MKDLPVWLFILSALLEEQEKEVKPPRPNLWVRARRAWRRRQPRPADEPPDFEW